VPGNFNTGLEILCKLVTRRVTAGGKTAALSDDLAFYHPETEPKTQERTLRPCSRPRGGVATCASSAVSRSSTVRLRARIGSRPTVPPRGNPSPCQQPGVVSRNVRGDVASETTAVVTLRFREFGHRGLDAPLGK
jgi:hypothetical protein